MLVFSSIFLLIPTQPSMKTVASAVAFIFQAEKNDYEKTNGMKDVGENLARSWMDKATPPRRHTMEGKDVEGWIKEKERKKARRRRWLKSPPMCAAFLECESESEHQSVLVKAMMI